MHRWIVLVAAVMAMPATAEEIYKCKGADGSTVFAPKPCGSDAVAVAIRPAPDAAVAPPTTEAVPGSAPSVADDKEAERRARQYADSVQASCQSGLQALAGKISYIKRRNMKMEPNSMFASDAELEGRRQAALRPLEAERDRIIADCEQRWRESYEAARFH